MKLCIIILSFLLGSSNLLAQFSDIDQFIIGNLGGEIKNSDYGITQSIGDIAGKKAGSISQGYILVQGFPQCFSCNGCIAIMSVDQTLSNPLVTIFPNPTTSILTLEGEERSLYRYELYSSNGQLINSDVLRISQIDLSILSPGIYFLRIYDIQEQVSFSGSLQKQ